MRGIDVPTSDQSMGLVVPYLEGYSVGLGDGEMWGLLDGIVVTDFADKCVVAGDLEIVLVHFFY